MDWGIDPDRVSEIAEIVRNRRFSAADAEKLMLAIVGGPANMPTARSGTWRRCCWRSASGAPAPLAPARRSHRLPPRRERPHGEPAQAGQGGEARRDDGPLRRRGTDAGLARRAAGLRLGPRQTGAGPRRFPLQLAVRRSGRRQRRRRAAPVPRSALPGGRRPECAEQARRAGPGPLHAGLAAARYLPLQAFAELIRHREAFIAEAKRGRDFGPEEVFELWRFAIVAARPGASPVTPRSSRP